MLPKPHLFGWNRAWPPDDRATKVVDAARVKPETAYDGPDAPPAIDWYQSESLRRLLGSEDLPMRPGRIQAQLGERAMPLLTKLVAGDFVSAYFPHPMAEARFGLSKAGRHTLDWAGAPKPEGVTERGPRGWAGQLAFAIAAHYDVDTHELLRTGTFGAPVRARARLCAALYARGWSIRAIEDYFWLPRGWGERGVARWRGGMR